jgi:hypothetical protein
MYSSLIQRMKHLTRHDEIGRQTPAAVGAGAVNCIASLGFDGINQHTFPEVRGATGPGEPARAKAFLSHHLLEF